MILDNNIMNELPRNINNLQIDEDNSFNDSSKSAQLIGDSTRYRQESSNSALNTSRNDTAIEMPVNTQSQTGQNAPRDLVARLCKCKII